MTQRFFRPLILALAGLLAAPILSRADMTNLALAKSEILEGNVAYLRVSHVAAGLPDEIGTANRALTATNKIAGTVLDLRFADGDDAAAATATANLFAAKKLLLAILVNGRTRGAAVVLATTLRESRAGLVFGSVPAAVKPDVSVEENPADEKKFFENPYAAPATNAVAASPGTNDFLSLVDHTSEADLVRAKIKDGDEFKNPPPHAAGPQKPVIRDPVLARAVDLIKGLAIVREVHP
ncbi:MAG: hypothetical protein ABSD57_13725 [Verrucomicrobiota bacterium]|jgi:hypothetical protein